MKIYTRQGDAGQTGLFDGRRVRKDDLRLETYGTIDELNSILGVAAAGLAAGEKHAELRGILEGLQVELFELGADLATPEDAANAAKVRRVTVEQVTALEGLIDHAMDRVPALKRFVLPGGSPTGAQLHVARTVCRRAERAAVKLADKERINPLVLAYVNRLSDLLFALARWANQLDGVKDIEWEPGKKEARR